MRIAGFIDVSYLRHALVDVRLDWQKLPEVLAKELAQRLEGDKADWSLRLTVLCGSVPTNVSPLDQSIVQKQERWFSFLSSLDKFEVNLHKIDYRGFRLKARDRQLSDNPIEQSFTPNEKTVDVALATRLLELRYNCQAYDACFVLTGDADLIPALQSIRSDGCPLLVVGANITKTMSLSMRGEGGYQWDFKPVELMRFVDVLRRDNGPNGLNNSGERLNNNNVTSSDGETVPQEPSSQSVRHIINLIDSDFAAAVSLLQNEISSRENELRELEKDGQFNLIQAWVYWYRLLESRLNPEAFDIASLREILQRLQWLSNDLRPGFIPALQREHIEDWVKALDGSGGQLLILS